MNIIFSHTTMVIINTVFIAFWIYLLIKRITKSENYVEVLRNLIAKDTKLKEMSYLQFKYYEATFGLKLVGVLLVIVITFFGFRMLSEEILILACGAQKLGLILYFLRKK